MHDAVTDRGRVDVPLVAQPTGGDLQRRRHVGNLPRAVGAINDPGAILSAHPQPRARADTVHLAFDLAREPA